MAYYPRRYFPGYRAAQPAQPYLPPAGPDPYSFYPQSYPAPEPMYMPARPAYRPYLPDYPPGPVPVPARPAPAPAPVATPTTEAQNDYIVNKRYKYYGYALMLLSVACFVVEIANIVFTYIVFKDKFSSHPINVPYILTWIADGVWGSIPVFITGFLAIRVAGTYSKTVRIFILFCSLSAVVFTPAIMAVSIAEIVVYPKSGDGQPMWSWNGNNDKYCYQFTDATTLSCPKFWLPLIVTVLGGVEFYLTTMVMIIFCCCWKPGKEKTTAAPAAAPTSVVTKPTDAYPDYPPYPSPAPIPSYPVYPSFSPGPPMIAPSQTPFFRALPPAAYDYDDQVALPPSGVMMPDMNFLRSYPAYRPATSRGFGYPAAFNPSSYGGGPFYGSNPSLTYGFGPPQPNSAYKVVYA